MNGPDRIEEALKRMEPAPLPPHLMARLTAARPDAERADAEFHWHVALFRWLLPIAGSACVALATFFLLEQSRHSREQVAPAAAVESLPAPAGSQDFLVSARSVGILVAPNQRPYRIMDVEWLELETQPAGADGRTTHTATRRRDVIPVALEVY